MPAAWIDTPTMGIVRGGIARGFRWLSITLVVYACSAVMASLSAGMWLLAIDTSNRRDPMSGAFNLAGGVTTLAAALLALAALVLLLVGSSLLRPSLEFSLGSPYPVLRWYRTALAGSFSLGAITALAVLGLMFSRGRVGILGPAVLVLTGATAVALLAAVLLPLHALGSQTRKVLLWIVTALSLATIIAEAVLPLGAISGISQPTNWLTFGGYPLFNWHLVFGAIVAGCSIFFARGYWTLASNFARRGPWTGAYPA